MSRPIASVAVVGGGFMGAGIAETAATCGIPVIIRELPEYLEATRQRLETSLDRAVKRGTRRRADRDPVLSRITLTSELEDVGRCRSRYRGRAERFDLKASIMEDARRHRRRSTPSSHRTRRLFRSRGWPVKCGTPSRVLGLHFFSAVPVMALVEIVRALDTSAETVERAHTFVAPTR